MVTVFNTLYPSAKLKTKKLLLSRGHDSDPEGKDRLLTLTLPLPSDKFSFQALSREAQHRAYYSPFEPVEDKERISKTIAFNDKNDFGIDGSELRARFEFVLNNGGDVQQIKDNLTSIDESTLPRTAAVKVLSTGTTAVSVPLKYISAIHESEVSA